MTTDTLSLAIHARSTTGTAEARRQRRAESIPAIIYGHVDAPLTVSIEKAPLTKAMKHSAFYSQIVDLTLDKQTIPAIVKEIQTKPGSDHVVHLDFFAVDMKAKLVTQVPLNFIGEEEAPGVKHKGGTFNRLVSEITVTCFPVTYLRRLQSTFQI